MFINYGNNSRLDALGFAPFGEVVNGLEVGNTRFANLQKKWKFHPALLSNERRCTKNEKSSMDSTGKQTTVKGRHT